MIRPRTVWLLMLFAFGLNLGVGVVNALKDTWIGYFNAFANFACIVFLGFAAWRFYKTTKR